MLPPAADVPPPPPPTPATAGAPPPTPVATLSPDGAYEWNGVQWVPRGYVAPALYRSAATRAKWVVGLFAAMAAATALGSGLGAQGLRFTPGWAVGWWFIPFANFVQPERVVEEAWRVTATPRPSTPMSRHAAGAAGLVRTWWAFWLLGDVGGAIVSAGTSGQTLQDLSGHTVAQIGADAVQLVAAGLAVAVVLALTSRQDRLGATGPDRRSAGARRARLLALDGGEC